jgi:predicted nucleotidyltransferase
MYLSPAPEARRSNGSQGAMVMVDFDLIKAFSERIALEFKPERIILFGSYASGKQQEASDIDLLVVLPFEGKATYKASEIRNKIRAEFPLDLIVRTPEQIKKRLAQNDWFMRDIFENGRTLYESDNSRVGG